MWDLWTGASCRRRHTHSVNIPRLMTLMAPRQWSAVSSCNCIAFCQEIRHHYSMLVPKDCEHVLACRGCAVYNFGGGGSKCFLNLDWPLVSGSECWTQVSSCRMNLAKKKSCFSYHMAERAFEQCCRFWKGVTSLGTHLANSSFICRWSWVISFIDLH